MAVQVYMKLECIDLPYLWYFNGCSHKVQEYNSSDYQQVAAFTELEITGFPDFQDTQKWWRESKFLARFPDWKPWENGMNIDMLYTVWKLLFYPRQR